MQLPVNLPQSARINTNIQNPGAALRPQYNEQSGLQIQLFSRPLYSFIRIYPLLSMAGDLFNVVAYRINKIEAIHPPAFFVLLSASICVHP